MSTTFIPVNIEYAVDGIVCGDIAITAAEGGIGYWSQIEKYDFRRWIPDHLDTLDVADDFIFYTLREWDGEAYAGRPIHITPTLIKRGIGLYLSGSPNTDPRNITEISDLNAVDSIDADIIVQLGAFGRLVYS